MGRGNSSNEAFHHLHLSSIATIDVFVMVFGQVGFYFGSNWRCFLSECNPLLFHTSSAESYLEKNEILIENS